MWLIDRCAPLYVSNDVSRNRIEVKKCSPPDFGFFVVFQFASSANSPL